MGKASSSKKVARAARAGGRTKTGQPRNLTFPGVLALVVILGLSLVVYARNDRLSQDLGGTPQFGDHIHLAFDVYACDDFLPVLPGWESPIGIHTHSDGVIHVHPISRLGTGANATLGTYFDSGREEAGLDMRLSDDGFTFLGDTFDEGSTECDGVDDPELRVAYWDEVTVEGSQPRVTTGGFDRLRLDTDGAGITVFFGDPDAEIPKPRSAPDLFQLGAIDGGQVPDVDPEGEILELPENLGQVEGEGEELDAPVAEVDVPGEGDDEAEDADEGDTADAP
jgi:hypothetical protein